MTAIRVVTDHQELEGSGQVTHSVIDTCINQTSWIVVSGSEFVPSSSRRLVAGDNVEIVDGGPGGDAVINVVGLTRTVVSWNEVPSGLNDGVNKRFTFKHPPSPSTSLLLFIGGIKQRQGSDSDYTLSVDTIDLITSYRSGTNIDGTYPYVTGSTLRSDVSWNEVPLGLNDGVNMRFTLLHEPVPSSSLMLFIGGVKQGQGIDNDYVLSGSTVDLVVDYLSGTNIDATYSYLI